MDFYPFRFDVKRLRPLLQRDLYKDPNVVLRELAQNAHDAIIRRAKLDKNFNPVRDGKIVFRIDKFHGTLDVFDNGVGMSKADVLETFRYYGRSDKDANDEVGTFGLGAKSIFAAADSFSIHTKSLETGEVIQVYAKLNGLAFQPSPPPRNDVGTTITITAQVKDDGSGKQKDDDEYSDDDEEKQSHKLNIAALRKFCRCVKVPLFIEKKDRRERVSQKDPWNQKESTCIPANNFEIYLGPNDCACKFYMEGFLIFEEQRNEYGMTAFALNFTQKDAINLTMSRDNIIRDKKYQAALKAARKTIIDRAQTAKFNRHNLTNGIERGLVKWLKDNLHSNLCHHISDDVQNAVEVLTSDILVCSPSKDGKGTTTTRTTLVDLLQSSRPKGSLFGRRKREVEELAKAKQMTIIYHQCRLEKSTLMTWLTTLGIKPIKKKRSKIEEYILHSPFNTERFNSITALESDWTKDKNKAPLFIFPKKTPLQNLQHASRHLGICAVRLDDYQNPTVDCIDLRQPVGTQSAIVDGKSQNIEHITANNVRVVPPEFFKFAHTTKSTKFAKLSQLAFTPNRISACLLIMRGADPADLGDLDDVLAETLPKKIHDLCTWWIGHVSHYRNIAALASELDWNHPHTPWLLSLATTDRDTAEEMVKALIPTQTTQRWNR